MISPWCNPHNPVNGIRIFTPTPYYVTGCHLCMGPNTWENVQEWCTTEGKSEPSVEQSIVGNGETDRSCGVEICTSLLQLQLLFVTSVLIMQKIFSLHGMPLAIL